jgi:hypothetical protein
LTANSALTEKWSKVIQSNGKFRVGLAWSGNPELKKPYYDRSCSLDAFSPLGHVKDITLYSLQKRFSSEQQDQPPEGIEIINYMDEIDDFYGTAALINNLDLVITIDSAVAHLAGALGKPVWTLLPFVPDWRWMLDREDSPWYPSMRLFRQPAPGDWKTVMEHVVAELKKAI